MTSDTIDECDYRGGTTPEATASGVEFQRQRAAETAEDRWERYQRTDQQRSDQCQQ